MLLQYDPAVHAVHSDEEFSPREFENVPIGHGDGTSVPAGQKNPAGQGPEPIVEEDGDCELLPDRQ